MIEFRKEGDVGVITINNPPANALSFAVVKGISEIVTSCKEDDSILAVVITGAGRMFVAGADIREFNMTRPVDVPEFHVLIKELEDSPKPIVAAINGIAFGGGLELAMGCHYRLIAPGALVGQPEVKLGIIPGAGGTQRLPRLVGIEIALEMIVEGAPINADRSLKIGVVYELLEDNLLGQAISFAKKRVPDGPRPTSGINNRLKNFESKIFDDFRAKITPKSRGLDAPYECINAVEVASNKPFEEGMRFERETFLRLRDGSKSKAMRHMFFAEREVAKIPDISKETIVQAIDGAAVIGSGTMGGGIAMNFANAGIPVFLVDVSQEVIDAGLDKVRQNYARSVSSGRFSQDIMDERMALITGTTDYEDVAGADIIIEAVFEDMVLKKKIFRELDQICKPEAILASNTSSLDINEIAASTSRPEKGCGTHFFSPANVMKLMENVRGELSSLETIATVMKLSKTLQKTGVLVGVGDGFVGNRMLHVAARVAEFMVEQGTLPWQVDTVIYEFGFPMGPFAMNDLAGVDVRYSIRQEQKKLYGDRRQSIILDRLYETGRYGQKTGGGWYTYENNSRTGTPEPKVEALIIETSKEIGFERRKFSDEEILERYLYSIINAGALVLEQRLALRSSDIDVIWHYGYGFPRYNGGPMFYADLIGLNNIYEKVSQYYDEYGDWLRPSKLLKSLADTGKSFGSFSNL